MDKPEIVNLTWAYTSGPTVSSSPSGVNLGDFPAQSTFNTTTQVSCTAWGVKNAGSQIGTIGDNVGNTQGPTALNVPEPGSPALVGAALMGLALVRGQRGARRSGRPAGGQ